MNGKSIYEIFCEDCNMQVTTDSRNCPEGSMFIALKGDKFNGNEYAEQALKKGCAYAVVDEEKYVTDKRTILVSNGLEALQQLAGEHRRKFQIPVIGITGTNGKTTTKELIAAVLGKKYNVLYTQGNLNNHIGVPLTLLRLRKEHDVAIIEMGANHPGEIKPLTEIANPTAGLITNVGKAHLEGFGSFETLVQTKCEMYDALKYASPEGVAFVDYDNEILMKQVRSRLHLQKTYGTDEHSDTRGSLMDSDPYMRLRVIDDNKEYEVATHLVGAYNLKNALAAVAVGKHFGVAMGDIIAALEEYVPTNNRSQMKETANNRLIIDTYNANPTSMMAALENFTQMKGDNKMLILGNMGELGSISREEHQRIVDYLRDNGYDEVWLVGKGFEDIDCQYRKFRDVSDVKQEITTNPVKGKLIMIKGSNSNRLFELPELL